MGAAWFSAHPRSRRRRWRGWPNRWPRPRSRACCASAGTPSGGSSPASSPTTSTSRAWPDWSRSASTRSHVAAASATSPASSTIRPARSCGARQPQRRDVAGVLHRARPAPPLDPRGVDRHERGYAKAIRDCIPDAQVCFDPFHVVRLASHSSSSSPIEAFSTTARCKSSRRAHSLVLRTAFPPRRGSGPQEARIPPRRGATCALRSAPHITQGNSRSAGFSAWCAATTAPVVAMRQADRASDGATSTEVSIQAATSRPDRDPSVRRPTRVR